MVENRRAPRRRAEDIYDRWSVQIRDTILYAVGIFGIVNELWIVPEPRTSVLVFLGSLVGVPVVLKADEKRVAKRDSSADEEE